MDNSQLASKLLSQILLVLTALLTFQLAIESVKYFVNVTVQLNKDASAPVHDQSCVICHPVAGVTAGAVSPSALQNVAVTIATPPVESDATGSLFTVAGARLQVASNSEFSRTKLADSVYVKAPKSSACLAGVTVCDGMSYMQMLLVAPLSI